MVTQAESPRIRGEANREKRMKDVI
ncbi:hypothetical protein MTBLM1_30055 [Rhodospirillaceae bacterium LM-1]|nr:hypothetical protein MTBLM1_30055 [Rhodospirillaceae bacterium LM-1]